ncbi:LysR family transcriptional regulator [Paenibacillus sacheonensis]|uniref:LysR family transcriptional regulator n=1 Tax=Paenibacillus sacheonensis TaxID=742054 RepID=A0A7X4YKX4_9BACL|nr:LysR family transcriptional regulator [Paenibacillus sacheonensis]MBM7564105.1 DNA-binding transcriptional LysR family regulator [Paenibacillus sacheonensis]NBC67566.1 LysR family transcriptional regulator [Paenibacillus sacheonensis]
MSILRLQILVLLDELKKVTAVAEEIGVKQPTVSFHMKKLEEEWGVPLFEIKTGKVLLTGPGRILLRYAVEIDRLYREAEARFQSYREHGKHGFIVGCTDAASSLLFGLDWRTKETDAVQMRLELRTGTHDDLLEQLHAGAIDLLVSGSFPERASTGQLQFQELAQERLLLFMNDSHPFAGTASIAPYKLAGQRFVELADSALREALRGWELHEKVSLPFEWTTDRIDLVLGAATGGGMLAVLPASAAERCGSRMLHVPLPGQAVYLKITAAWRSDYWNPSFVQRIVALLSRSQTPA